MSQESSDERKLISAKEVAREYGIALTRVYELAKKNAIPNIRIEGRIYFRPVSIETWFDEQERGGE